MSLSEQVQKDLTLAMKSQDSVRKDVLRMLKTALKYRQIEKRAALTASDEMQVVKTLIKQRGEAMQQYQAAGRTDLAEKERREETILRGYLPEPASVEELEQAVATAIQETGAAGPKDMGKVMKAAMGRLQQTGKTVDGKQVNALVRAQLEAIQPD